MAYKATIQQVYAKGATKQFTYVLNPNEIMAGHVTLVAQDDTTVTDFKVEITGCCTDPSVVPKSKQDKYTFFYAHPVLDSSEIVT
jgi:hypothetical protein